MYGLVNEERRLADLIKNKSISAIITDKPELALEIFNASSNQLITIPN
jgi:hypothetical protein